MSAPVVNIVSISKNRISDEIDEDRTVVVFSFDVDVVEWVVRVVGTSPQSGILADSYVGSIPSGTTQSAEIDWTECYQEGENRVNIYGKSTTGEWTYYDGIAPPDGDDNTALTFAVQ